MAAAQKEFVPEEKPSAAALYESGLKLYKQNKLEEARKNFEAALARVEKGGKEEARIRAHLGWTYFKLGNFGKALENFKLSRELGVEKGYEVEDGAKKAAKRLSEFGESLVGISIGLVKAKKTAVEPAAEAAAGKAAKEEAVEPAGRAAEPAAEAAGKAAKEETGEAPAGVAKEAGAPKEAEEKEAGTFGERAYDAVTKSYVPGRLDPAAISNDLEVIKEHDADFATRAGKVLTEMWGDVGRLIGKEKLSEKQAELVRNYMMIWTSVIFYRELLAVMPTKADRELLVGAMGNVAKTLDKSGITNRMLLLYSFFGEADTWHEMIRNRDGADKLRNSILMFGEESFLADMRTALTEIKNNDKVAGIIQTLAANRAAMEADLIRADRIVDDAYSSLNASYSQAELENNPEIMKKQDAARKAARAAVIARYSYRAQMLMRGKAEPKEYERLIRDENGVEVGVRGYLKDWREDTSLVQARTLKNEIDAKWGSWSPEQKFGWLAVYYGLNGGENQEAAKAVMREQAKLDGMRLGGKSRQEIDGEISSFLGGDFKAGVTFDTVGKSKLAREVRLSLFVWGEGREAKEGAMSLRVDPRSIATSLPALEAGKLALYDDNRKTVAQAEDDRLSAIYGFAYFDIGRAAGLAMLSREEIVGEYMAKRRQAAELGRLYSQPGSNFIIAYDKEMNVNVFSVSEDMTGKSAADLHAFVAIRGNEIRANSAGLNAGMPDLLGKVKAPTFGRGGETRLEGGVTLVAVSTPKDAKPEDAKNVLEGVGLSNERALGKAVAKLDEVSHGEKLAAPTGTIIDIAASRKPIGNTHGIEDMQVLLALTHRDRYEKNPLRGGVAFSQVGWAVCTGAEASKLERAEPVFGMSSEMTWIHEKCWARVGTKETAAAYGWLAGAEKVYVGEGWDERTQREYLSHYKAVAAGVSAGEIAGKGAEMLVPRIEMPDGEIRVKRVGEGEKIVDSETGAALPAGSKYFEIVRRDERGKETVARSAALRIAVSETRGAGGEGAATVQTNKPELELRAYYNPKDIANATGLPKHCFHESGELEEGGVEIGAKRVVRDGKEYFEISAESLKADPKSLVALAARTKHKAGGMEAEGYAYSTVTVPAQVRSPYNKVKYREFKTVEGAAGLVVDSYAMGNFTMPTLHNMFTAGSNEQLEGMLDGSNWVLDETGAWALDVTNPFSATVSGAKLRDSIKDDYWVKTLGVSSSQLSAVKAELDNRELTQAEAAQIFAANTGNNIGVLSAMGIMPKGTVITINRQTKVLEIDLPLVDLFGGELGFGGIERQVTSISDGKSVKTSVKDYPMVAYYHDIGERARAELKLGKDEFIARFRRQADRMGVSEVYYEKRSDGVNWGMEFTVSKGLGVVFGTDPALRIRGKAVEISVPLTSEGVLELRVDPKELLKKIRGALKISRELGAGGGAEKTV